MPSFVPRTLHFKIHHHHHQTRKPGGIQNRIPTPALVAPSEGIPPYVPSLTPPPCPAPPFSFDQQHFSIICTYETPEDQELQQQTSSYQLQAVNRGNLLHRYRLCGWQQRHRIVYSSVSKVGICHSCTFLDTYVLTAGQQMYLSGSGCFHILLNQHITDVQAICTCVEPWFHPPTHAYMPQGVASLFQWGKTIAAQYWSTFSWLSLKSSSQHFQ